MTIPPARADRLRIADDSNPDATSVSDGQPSSLARPDPWKAVEKLPDGVFAMVVTRVQVAEGGGD